MDSRLNFLVDSYITYELIDRYSFQFNLHNRGLNIITNVIAYTKVELSANSKYSNWLPEINNNFTLKELIESKSNVIYVNHNTEYLELIFDESNRIKMSTPISSNENCEIRTSNGFYEIY